MDQRTELARLKAAMGKVVKRGKRTRYPKLLRIEVARFLRKCRQQGATMSTVIRDLGITKHTSDYWQKTLLPASEPNDSSVAACKQPHEQSLRPVMVLVPSAPPASTMASGIVVHGPAGVRIEGLDVDTLACLLRRLS